MSHIAHPTRILALESSGLLAALTATCDPSTRSADGLERLLGKATQSGEPLVERIVIPDHALYELTDLLPPCHQTLLEKLTAARADDAAEMRHIAEAKRHLSSAQAALLKPSHHLEKVIDFYTLISPRGEVNDAKRQQKNHIRVLLRFLAAHPESLTPTQTGRSYCNRLVADYSMLSARGEVLKESLDHYRPTFADAFHYLKDDFNLRDLRIHVGQLMMMGLITEREFANRLGEDEKALGTKKRFYKTGDFINHLAGIGNQTPTEDRSPPLIDQNMVQQLRAAEGIDATNGRYQNLTAGFFIDHPEILQRAHARVGTLPATSCEPDATATMHATCALQAALSPSPLLLEHYFFSGILPRDTASRLMIAQTLGLSVAHLSAQSTDDRVREVLTPQGFEEISPTLPQLEAIREALRPLHPHLMKLNSLITHVRSNDNPASTAFIKACKLTTAAPSPSNGGATNSGLPYEKVYSDALGSGFIGWPVFWKLAKPGLHPFGEFLGTDHADVLVLPGLSDKNTKLYIAQDGIEGRSGTQQFDGLDCPTVNLTPVNGQRRYYEISVPDLLTRMHDGLTDRSKRTPLYRVCERLLLPRVAENAATVRRDALGLLGEVQTVQLEKDFANRWARRTRCRQLPFEDPFTALHTNSRIQRKNLGETATLEAATQALHDYPEAHVWLAGHDSDLYPSPEHGRAPQLEESVVRQHAGMLNGKDTLDIRALNQQAHHKHLHYVTSPALVDMLRRLAGQEPRGRYDFIKMKDIIAHHPNNSWKRLGERTLGYQR